MLLIKRFRLRFACCIGLLSGCLLSTLLSAQTLVLAQLSDRPKKDFRQLRPMVEHMARHLADMGISRGEVRLFRELPALVEAVRAGEVHWVTETALVAAVLQQEAGAIPLLRKWKHGLRDYQSLIYVRADAPVRTLADLPGHTLAFEHNTSFSSYYLPRHSLESAGLSLEFLARPGAQPAPGKLGVLFSRNEKNNLLWVHKGLVTAGALNNGDWHNPQRVPSQLHGELRILHRSALYPRALEIVSPQLAPALRERLRQALLAMSQAEHGDLLARYERTTRFEPVEAEIPPLLQQIYHASRQW